MRGGCCLDLHFDPPASLLPPPPLRSSLSVEAGAGPRGQVRNVLWKNWLFKRRAPCSTLAAAHLFRRGGGRRPPRHLCLQWGSRRPCLAARFTARPGGRGGPEEEEEGKGGNGGDVETSGYSPRPPGVGEWAAGASEVVVPLVVVGALVVGYLCSATNHVPAENYSEVLSRALRCLLRIGATRCGTLWVLPTEHALKQQENPGTRPLNILFSIEVLPASRPKG